MSAVEAVLSLYRPMVFLARRAVLVVFAAVVFPISACGTGTVDPPKPTSCPADDYESNDTRETARELPSMQDHPDSTTDVVDLTVHSTADEDWFRIPIQDTGLGGDPVITAIVSSTSFEVSTWFLCDEGNPTLECQVGSEADRISDGHIGYQEGCRGVDSEPDSSGSDGGARVNFAVSTTDCSGTSDDNGMLYVRVRHVPSFTTSAELALKWECGYQLSVRVE